MKKLLTLIILTTAFGAAIAQTADNRISIPINVTLNHYDGALGNEIFKLKRASAGFETGLKYYLNSSFNVAGNFSAFRLGYDTYKIGAQDFDISLEYKFNNGNIMEEDSKWKPFLTAGFGILHDKDFADEKNNALIPIGAGVRYQISESVDGLLETRYKLNASKNGPNYLTTSIGLVFTPRSKKDSDGDGVPDRLDACPNAAGTIGTKGCPDADGDGVADREDNCPQIAGLAKFMGCADTDSDGIPDLQDACPNEAGTAENKGCPDTDGDGIVDKDDSCPNVAGTVANGGCPDTDGDGIVDKDDKCPNVAGLAANQGCPEKDTDNDGVIDKNDSCPTTAGPASNNGCPELNEEVKQVLLEALEGVQFKSGSDDLIASSNAKLDKVVRIMKENSSFNLKISGYTDNTGNADSNLALSERRSQATKQYLVNEGISADRIEAHGYGIVKPVADNGTAAGRAKNRRVEFEVVFN